MANPVFVNCTADAWTKVATNITEGVLHRVNGKPNYRQSYVNTGGAAPTVSTEGVTVFENSSSVPISSSPAIDVYIWCDGSTGRVRLDQV